MGKYIFLLDSGHGGMVDGKYQTSTKWWKRAYFKDGKLLNPDEHTLEWLEINNDLKYYEGVGNRDIVKRVMRLCDIHSIKYYDILEGSELDVSLSTRVRRANTYYKNSKNCIYLSVHSNAFTKESAQGFSVYTTPGFTNSDKIAPIIFKEMAIEFADHKPRKDEVDGDVDKEANFYVLKHTSMPAILSENLFYTNYRECKILSSEEGRQRIAEAHFKGIIYIEKNGY